MAEKFTCIYILPGKLLVVSLVVTVHVYFTPSWTYAACFQVLLMVKVTFTIEKTVLPHYAC